MFYFSLVAGSLVIIPFVLGCTIYRRLDKGTRKLVWFFALIIIAETCVYFIRFTGYESFWPVHIYTVLELFFIVTILGCWQHGSRRRKYFYSVFPSFLCLSFAAKLTIERVREFDNYSAALAAVIIVFLSVITLIDLFSNQLTFDAFYGDHRFWICLTFLFYSIGISVCYAIVGIPLAENEQAIFPFPIYSLLRIFEYTGLTVGLLCFVPRPIFSPGPFRER